MLRRRSASPRPLALVALAGTMFLLALTRLGAASAATVNVAMADNTFTPGTVTITAGDTVIWTDNGARPHTVTADDGSFDSGNMATGQTFSRAFDTPGTFAYFCRIHGAAGGVGMSGRIVVQAAQVVTTTTAAPTTTTTATTVAGGGGDTTSTTPTTAPTTVSATAQQPADGLANTGDYTGAMAAIGLAFVLTGIVVVRRSALFARDDGGGSQP